MAIDDFLARIEAQYKSQRPFVAYRKPNDILVNAILQQNDNIYIAEQFTEKGFVFSPFDDNGQTVLIPLSVSESFKFRYQTENHPKEEIKASKIDEVSKSNHIDLVNNGISAIKNDEFKKVVLSRKESVSLSKNNPLSIFKRLLNSYPKAFVYCWYHPKVGLWLGATPETLVKIEGKQFSVMALAGTQEYQGTLNVLWQDKEKQEQQFVTDFIVENLENVVGNIKISNTETVRAGNLVHLKTIISARLNPKATLKDVVFKLHPTPAVCGYPKAITKQFILKNEGYNREFYSGFLGELNFETIKTPRLGKRNIENRAYAISTKSTQLYVNLRCMQLQGNQAFIYVGGGITEHSNAESEWWETVAKSIVVKSVL
ncbi:MAG: chorismate-binding protein [Aestuariibaculum sp.]